MKVYDVFDQRFPDKTDAGWTARLVPVGQVMAIDAKHALRLAKARARFPMVYNAQDFRDALIESKKEPEPLWA